MDGFNATLAAPIHAHFPFEDARVVERDGWHQLITPSTGSAVGNEVYMSKTPAAEIERVIDDVMRMYTTPFKWCVGPWTQPHDLEQRLITRGFTSWGARGMFIEVAGAALAAPPDVEVRAVASDLLDEYLRVSAEGWAAAPSERDAIDAVWHGMIHDERRKHFAFTAYIDGAPVATAGLVMKDDSGYLTGGNVLEKHRGRGIYRALLRARLDVLRARGVRFATTHAREATSAPILDKLGFTTAFRYRVCLSKSLA